MPGLNYWAIEEELREILSTDTSLEGVKVILENDSLLTYESMPCVGIFLTRRNIPEEQPVMAGRKMYIDLEFSIWCFVADIENLSGAAKKRDELLNKVEVILLGNRTLNDKVDFSYIDNGDFDSAFNPNTNQSIMGAEIKLIARTSSIL